MSDDRDDSEPASSPAEVIRRHVRGIRMALGAIDLAYPGAQVITDRMRGTTDTLTVDLSQIADFTRSRT